MVAENTPSELRVFRKEEEAGTKLRIPVSFEGEAGDGERACRMNEREAWR